MSRCRYLWPHLKATRRRKRAAQMKTSTQRGSPKTWNADKADERRRCSKRTWQRRQYITTLTLTHLNSCRIRSPSTWKSYIWKNFWAEIFLWRSRLICSGALCQQISAIYSVPSRGTRQGSINYGQSTRWCSQRITKWCWRQKSLPIAKLRITELKYKIRIFQIWQRPRKTIT